MTNPSVFQDAKVERGEASKIAEEMVSTCDLPAALGPFQAMLRPGSCVLMFSGGRDSTLAALRLLPRYPELTLVTVTSDHLVGIDTVRQRIGELRPLLSENARWLHAMQPRLREWDGHFDQQTCLPCHLAYALVGAAVADQVQASAVAFGYTTYQGSWPEQTPYATQILRRSLGEAGFRLELPVYDLATKEQAVAELTSYKLTSGALEQKCLKQVSNRTLPPPELTTNVDRWGEALSRALGARHELKLRVAPMESI